MKVGIIGCGGVSISHLEALERMPQLDVVAVCDRHEHRAAEVARRFGIERTYGEAEELLEAEHPDAVHVLTPPQGHKRISIEAMEAGAHVLVEKPMALDSAEAEEMIEASRGHGRSLCVSHAYLFNRGVLEARELLTRGRLGRVVAVETFWRPYRGPGRKRSEQTPWLEELPGGPVHEVAPHAVYLLQSFLGRLTLAHAVERALPGEADPGPEFQALFEGESGLGTACISYSAHPFQSTFRVYGTEMTVHVDLPGEVAVPATRDEYRRGVARMPVNLALGARLIVGAVSAGVAALRGPVHPAHAALIERFYESLRSGSPPPVSGEDGRAAVDVLDSLWRAVGRMAPAEAE